MEVSGLTEYGEIEENEQSSTIPTINSVDQANLSANSRGRFNIGARGNTQSGGRGRRPFVRHTGEIDPNDISVAPMNIYEN